MPRTYTASGVTLLGDGEETGVWGQLVNTNMQIMDRMVSQAGTITLSGTTHTLTVSDGVLSDGQYGVLVFGGSPSGTNTVTISPNDAKRTFIVKNDSGQTVTLTQGSGGDVSVVDGRTAIVYCDGAGSGAAVVNVSDTLVPATVQAIGALAPTDGNFVVGDGSTWVAESGDTALASLGVTSTAAELNLLDGVTWTLADYNTLTSTAAELNLLDGVTWTLTDYNTLTSTAAELNLLDGKSLSGSDAQLITGTAGTAGHITRWDSNGDLVSYGQATQTEGAWTTGTSTTESLVSPAKVKAAIDASVTVETAQATTSGSTFDFTGIPDTVTNITISFAAIDLSGSDSLLVRIGDSGGVETTGYVSASTLATAAVSDSTGFIMYAVDASGTFTGSMHLVKHDGDTWVATHSMQRSAGNSASGAGSKTLSAALDRIQLTTNGSNTFTAGSVNVLYW